MKRLTVKIGLVMLFLFCINLWVPTAYAFTDLKNDHWAKKDIEHLVARQIISGYSDGTYGPDKGVTRAEFTVLLIKALNLEDTASTLRAAGQLFRDVKANHWAKGYIHLAWELGVVGGYSDGTFRPDNTIRRDEMISMLIRALRDIGQGSEKVTFADENLIPAWAKSSVLQAAEWGLVSGFEDGTFRPGTLVTRAQAAIFINNFLQQRGAQFDFFGQIVSINKGSRQLTVDYNGERITFSYNRDCKIYHNGTPIAIDALEQRVSSYGFFVLGNQGHISFIDLVNSPSVSGSDLTIGSQTPIREAEKANVGKQAGILERELDRTLSSAKVNLERAKKILEVTKEDLGVKRLSEELGVDGSGQVIAIIDSGIDPGHPDLLQTSRGQEKLIDFVDLTTEGLVNTEQTISARSAATLDGVSYNLGNILSKSNVYHYGFFEEEKLGFDVNFNGNMTERFLVLVTDSKVRGVYDTVYIDTNNNGSLLDEEPITLYRDSKKRQSFKSN
jgi:tripeptidyl-peptidase-2